MTDPNYIAHLIKEAYYAGFSDGVDEMVDGGEFLCDKYYGEVIAKAYKEWKSEQT